MTFVATNFSSNCMRVTSKFPLCDSYMTMVHGINVDISPNSVTALGDNLSGSLLAIDAKTGVKNAVRKSPSYE